MMPSLARLVTPLAMALALSAPAGCGGVEKLADGGGATANAPCSFQAPSMPTVHLGPDATIRTLCGRTTQAPIASVDERGNGVTSFSLSVEGSPELIVSPGVLMACQLDGPTVAFVLFSPTPEERPGQTFDGVVTVHAADGSFPDGRVKVHAEIVKPTVTVSPEVLDFGDVPLGSRVMRELSLVTPFADLSLLLTNLPNPDFAFTMLGAPVKNRTPQIQTWEVSFTADTPGDHVHQITWTATPADVVPPVPECSSTGTITLRAHVLAADAAAPGGDAGDAGADAP
jgi:hypothetical protein